MLTFSISASVALAQDPAVDQYAPSTPTVGGPETPTEPPVPATEPGGGPADVGTSGGGGDDGSSSPSGTSGSETSTTAPTETTSGTAATGTTTKAVEAPKNRDKGTVEGLAASAEQQREATSDAGQSPVTNLARSDDGGGDGVGILLFALLGITLVWAIASGVSRRRSEDGHPA